LHPTVDEDITVDKWGSIVSGYAPIQKKGQTVAVLGIDMSADEYVALSQSIFSPIAMLLVVTAALTIGASLILFLFTRRLESLHSLDMERSGLLRLAFHQIGQPLAIINWSLELLREQVSTKDAVGILVNMEEGVARLQQILYTLRDADLIHAGKMQYDARAGSLNETINEVAAETKRRLDQRNQTLTVTLSDDVEMELDKKLIGSVLRELLNNAIDYSPVGSTIAIRTIRRVRDVLVEVEDHGCGIPLADRDRIFGEFVRGANAYIYRADGSGLGLYIIQGIIRKAGGNIWFSSTLGKGSTFSFTLPLA
jgi:signal transduction histidine kinase